MKKFQNVAKKIVNANNFSRKEVVSDADVLLLTRKELIQILMPGDGVCLQIFNTSANNFKFYLLSSALGEDYFGNG